MTLTATETLQQQEVTSLTSPTVETYIPVETALNSAGAASNVAPQLTELPQPCDVATALLE